MLSASAARLSQRDRLRRSRASSPCPGSAGLPTLIVELREKVAGRVTDEIVVRHTPSDDPRTLAREGLLGLGFTIQEADSLLEKSGGETAEELIAGALRGAR